MSHNTTPEMQHEYIQAKRNELEAILAKRHAEADAGENHPSEIPLGPLAIPGPAREKIVCDGGKRKRSLNALRHGLTGQTVLMPWEDYQAYEAFCCEFLEDLAPVGFEQIQLAQTVVDCQWRLNRASAYENAILTYRAYMADQAIHDDTAVEGEFAKARAFPITQKDILNISLYESRLQRKMLNARKALKELQKEPRPDSEPRPQRAVPQTQPQLPTDPQPPTADPRISPGSRPPVPGACEADFVFSDLESFCAPPPVPAQQPPNSAAAFENMLK